MIGKDFGDHLVPAPLPRAGAPSTRLGCSKARLDRALTFPGMGYLQLLWATSALTPAGLVDAVLKVGSHRKRVDSKNHLP